jgi:aminoglycoside/choline kinase family phosphotransferase
MNTLLSDYFGRSIAPRKVITLKGDASSRRYHRIVLPEGITPGSLIVMELPEDALKSDEVTQSDRPEELPFVDIARHLRAAGLRVPEVYLDATDRGALLLEDLGDRLLVDVIQVADDEKISAWYIAAVDVLAEMHKKMWPVPASSIAARRCFDYNLLRWELDHYREWGAEALQGRALDITARKQLDAAFDALAREIDALPKGFVHRDYQSRNLMVLAPEPKKENLGIIDFQDAFQGPRVYDLVALLNDSYVSLSEDTKRAVIARYADAFHVDEEALAVELDLVTIQRKLKDGGRFVYIDRVKGNPSFLPFVDVSFERVSAALRRALGHEPLKRALAAADPARFALDT